VTEAPGLAEFQDEVASRLGSYVKRAEQALMAEKSRVLREHGLTVAQYSALMLLRYVPEASAAQLSRACLVTPQTMATILSNLEQKGLVSREPSALHQRVLSTQLTATGTSVVRKADHAAKNVEERLSAQFTADERDQLKGLLDRVVTTLHGRKAAAQKSAETL
jgi:DNA-binding MarR family transcriptional regulator